MGKMSKNAAGKKLVLGSIQKNDSANLGLFFPVLLCLRSSGPKDFGLCPTQSWSASLSEVWLTTTYHEPVVCSYPCHTSQRSTRACKRRVDPSNRVDPTNVRPFLGLYLENVDRVSKTSSRKLYRVDTKRYQETRVRRVSHHIYQQYIELMGSAFIFLKYRYYQRQ